MAISRKSLKNAMEMKHMTSPTQTGTYELAVRAGEMFKTITVMVLFPQARPCDESEGCLVVNPRDRDDY